MFSTNYSCFFAVCPLLLLGCMAPDAGDVRAAMAGAAAALESGDAKRLFYYVDERSRFALAATVKARREARQIIEAEYPESERAGALAALGEAATVETPEELFALRCGLECMRALAGQVGAPVAEVQEGDELRVTTSRGGTLHMFAGTGPRYGIVWNTRACAAERSQAARDLQLIRENAAIYRKRRELAAP